eukprot:554167_1
MACISGQKKNLWILSSVVICTLIVCGTIVISNNSTPLVTRNIEITQSSSSTYAPSAVTNHEHLQMKDIPNIESFVSKTTCLVISDEFKFIWIKIAKTGGSSLLKILKKQLCNITFSGSWNTNKRCVTEDILHFSGTKGEDCLHTMTTDIINKWQTYFVFTVIRNPYSRLISITNYCKIHLLCFNPTKQCGRCSLQHCNPYSSQIINPTTGKFYVDYIIKMESYQKDIDFVTKVLHAKNEHFPVNLTLPFVNKAKMNNQTKIISSQCVNTTLTKYYSQDMDIYAAQQ